MCDSDGKKKKLKPSLFCWGKSRPCQPSFLHLFNFVTSFYFFSLFFISDSDWLFIAPGLFLVFKVLMSSLVVILLHSTFYSAVPCCVVLCCAVCVLCFAFPLLYLKQILSNTLFPSLFFFTAVGPLPDFSVLFSLCALPYAIP
jgi:hypothetical protein